MFVDYYAVLDIPHTSTLPVIRSAYKKQAQKWHPDKNSQDTTMRMQLINEAKFILCDEDARKRYDIEYLKFICFQETNEKQTYNSSESTQTKKESSQSYEYTNYDIQDDILLTLIKYARKRAKEIIMETAELSQVGVIAAFGEIKKGPAKSFSGNNSIILLKSFCLSV